MEVLSSRVLLSPRDQEKSTAFYRDQLGLAIYRTYPGGTVFFTGQGFLEVTAHEGAGRTADLALWLQVRDLPAILAELRDNGVDIVRDAKREPWGLDEAWIADPDGTRIVLVQIPADHPLRTDVREP